MSERMTVQGTIEMEGVLIYVRFDASAPQELLNLAARVSLKRTQVPGLQTKGGEKGLFSVVIRGREIDVVGTQLEGREAWNESQESTNPPATDHAGRKQGRAASSDQDRGKTSRSETGTAARDVEDSAISAHDRFIHPYNFVRLPSEEMLAEVMKDGLFKRGASARHDLYDSRLKSGHIECQLTTQSEWFIPDPRKRYEQEDNTRHKTSGYFTLEDVHKWDENNAESDGTKPAIPASSLRGMVRSIFETVTFSCFSVFDSSLLDFRIKYGPDYDGANVGTSGKGVAEFIPARIVNVTDEEGTAGVEFLDGRYASDDAAVIRMALLDSYDGKVVSGNGPTSDLTSILMVTDGCALAVRLKKTARTHRTGFKYRVATDPLMLFDGHHPPADASDVKSVISKLTSWASKKRETANEFIAFGFLHRTGPNFGKKHFERFFFRAESTYNNPAHPAYIQAIEDRFCAFLDDRQNNANCDRRVVQATVDSLTGYADRNGKQITRANERRPRLPILGSRRPLPSDFIEQSPDEVCIRNGDLFYALCETTAHGDREVWNLYPVAIPRITHPNTRGELLPELVFPCGRRHECCPACQANLENQPYGERVLCADCLKRHENLCPACRVFGWTRDLTQLRGLKSLTDRIDSWAAHVRFTHATLDGEWNDELARRARRVVLPILNSPKPTTTGFYLQPLDNWEQAREARWPPVLKHVSDKGVPVPGYHTPAYRRDEARLRGRKQYRRRDAALPSSIKCGRMNQTVHVLPDKLQFTFRVHFDNLTDAELGALIFSLNLNVPENWKQGLGNVSANTEFRHALGHGKPLGMGRCSITASTICIDGSDRYSSARFNSPTAKSTGRNQEASDMQPFLDAWDKLSRNAEAVQSRSDFLEMLATLSASELVQYPPSEKVGEPNFEWWKTAKAQGVQLPEPCEERTEPTHRLPIRTDDLPSYAESQRNRKTTN